jgi:hypothetical protein
VIRFGANFFEGVREGVPKVVADFKVLGSRNSDTRFGKDGDEGDDGEGFGCGYFP